MTPAQLLAELRRRRVELIVVDQQRLHWYAPPGALTPELLRALHAAQADLIQLLRHPQARGAERRRILVQPGPPGHVSYARLAFWRWLVVTGRADVPPAGPPAGPYADPVARWQRERGAEPPGR
ncbi:MAG TPA: hypothetical protein VKZ60_08755 [Chloroflexota bacterium]|nr:hypothetical protein [Chloroflexota bacterium]